MKAKEKKASPELRRMVTAKQGPHGTVDEYEFNEKQEQVFHNLIGIIYSCAVMFFLMFLVTIVQILYEASQDKGAPQPSQRPPLIDLNNLLSRHPP